MNNLPEPSRLAIGANLYIFEAAIEPSWVPVEVAELAELAFRAWLTGPGQLPAEFAPSRNAGQ